MFSGRHKHRKRVAIFGGSFNPPHIGHTAICKWLFSRGIADEVWVVPCYKHPFGKPLVDFHHRLSMCRLAFGKLLLPVKTLTVERDLGGTSHTLRTVEHLKRMHPECRMSLVHGGDVGRDFHDWHEFGKICEQVEIIHVPRGPSSTIPDVSSTEVRERIAGGVSMADVVETEVAVYIITKGLYR